MSTMFKKTTYDAPCSHFIASKDPLINYFYEISKYSVNICLYCWGARENTTAESRYPEFRITRFGVLLTGQINSCICPDIEASH